MKIIAAVAWEAKRPLEVEEIEIEGPKTGEVLVRMVASGVCHTDAFTLSGEDPKGVFPCVLGHEGGWIVEEVGPGVTSLKVGDQVIPPPSFSPTSLRRRSSSAIILRPFADMPITTIAITLSRHLSNRTSSFTRVFLKPFRTEASGPANSSILARDNRSG